MCLQTPGFYQLARLYHQIASYADTVEISCFASTHLPNVPPMYWKVPCLNFRLSLFCYCKNFLKLLPCWKMELWVA